MISYHGAKAGGAGCPSNSRKWTNAQWDVWCKSEYEKLWIKCRPFGETRVAKWTNYEAEVYDTLGLGHLPEGLKQSRRRGPSVPKLPPLGIESERWSLIA